MALRANQISSAFPPLASELTLPLATTRPGYHALGWIDTEVWPTAKHQLCVFHVLQDVTSKVLEGSGDCVAGRPGAVRPDANLFDERPVFVESEVEADNHHSNAGQDRAHQGRKKAGPENVHKQAVANLFRLVAGLVL
jgi:hypothetical protein